METSSQLEDLSTVDLEETDSSSSLVQEQEVLQITEPSARTRGYAGMRPSDEGWLLKETYLRQYRSRRQRWTIIILFGYAVLRPLIWLSDRRWERIG